jgi:hypothetical protein
MIDQFAFLGDNCKAIAVAMSFAVLLFLPSSLGFGGGTIIIQEAFGQFNLPLLEEEETGEENGGGLVVEEEEEEEEDTTTTTTTITPTTPTTTATDTMRDPSTYMLAEVNRDALRGLIGSTLPARGVATGTTALTAGDDDGDDVSDGHIVTGRFRLFANETIVRRFITEMNVAAIDGSSFHNITIEEDAPDRFPATQGNGTTTTTTAVASSSIVGRIYLDGGATPVIGNVPMTLTIRDQSLTIENIDVDETRITDPRQRDAISAIDGQSIYGIVE